MQTQTKAKGQVRTTITTPPISYCLYARKSTESDERQQLSIDSQISEMLALAKRENIEISEIIRESHSAKDSNQRPEFNRMISDIRSGRFNAILTWAPDRLSRNGGDLGMLVDLMDQKLLTEIRTYNQHFINSPNEKFLLMILCSQAKLENDNRGLNVKRGLKAKVEMGLWPGTAPTGYLNEKNVDRKCHILVDPQRAPIIRKVFEKVGNDDWSGLQTYHWLKDEIKFTTKNDKFLSLSNIYILLRNTFYTGHYEYPKDSGNWYTGKHTPLITQELYDKVQERLDRDKDKGTWGSKEFAFTKLIKCGSCGSGITAMEKFKKLKGGGINKYIYYGCTRSKNRHCPTLYIREEELVEQLLKIVDKLTLDELGVKEKLQSELDRYSKFKTLIEGESKTPDENKINFDTKNYVKYLLQSGTIYEKREMLSCMKSKLVLVKKELELEK